MVKPQDEPNEDSEYGEYWMEGEKGETFYHEAKKIVKNKVKMGAESLAKELCQKEYPNSKTQVKFCKDGIRKASFNDKEILE
jgi:hypothetical protein